MKNIEIIESSKRMPIALSLFKNKISDNELFEIYGGACDNVCHESVRIPDCKSVIIDMPKCGEFDIAMDEDCALFLQCPGTQISCENVTLEPWP